MARFGRGSDAAVLDGPASVPTIRPDPVALEDDVDAAGPSADLT
jgi:hypothetical protein